MKMILVCAATDLELKPIKNALKNIRNCKIVYCIYGVGIPLSMFALQKFISEKKIDVMIAVGIAGSFKKKMPLESVVIIQQDCFGDMGAFRNNKFMSLFEMGWINANKKPFQKEQLINPHIKKFDANHLPLTKAITVQQMSSDKKAVSILQKKYDADIESMEGACFHFIALTFKIPFLQLRAISNFVGETDKKKWSISKALENLSIATKKIIEKL